MMIKLNGTPTVITYIGDDFMIYVGIDIAKQNYFASVMNSDGEILVQPFAFTNDMLGFKKLLSQLSVFFKMIYSLVWNHTAHYAKNLTCFLYARDFNVCIINQIQTAAIRKSNIRKTKTDKVDTFLIINVLNH